MRAQRKAYLREYQKAWIRERRKSWFEGRSCAKCGSQTALELDHINPEDKLSNHIWSWTKKRRDDELIKCQVLCKSCHRIKTSKDLAEMFRGKPNLKLRTISDEQILEVLSLIEEGISGRKACLRVGINGSSFRYIKSKGYRPHLFRSKVADK